MPSDKKKLDQKVLFARSLSSEQLTAVLQNELMKSREQRLPTVTLLNEIVHDLKFRLKHYSEKYGEIKQLEEEA